ncbi:MAG: bifunctional adenosylcobinamide kinase/adenosylcobinamide-phosphate guanylyltransferase [Ktedonobacteraceae bacterium]
MSDPQEQSVLASSTNLSAPPKLVLILGGARSGKSTFAERLAGSSRRNVAFIATATTSDEDMRQRIARHRASRPEGWHTLEEPVDLIAAVRHAANLADVMLLDCMTLWLANWLGQQGDINLEQDASLSDAYTNGVLKDIEELLATIATLAPNKTLIVVSNEVGLGIVPAYPLGRIYRDMLGLVNQRLAHAADRVYLMVAGLGIDIKRLHEEASL